MKPDWKAIICAICGICIGCLFMGIYADRQITKLETSLYEQTQSTHQWIQRYETTSVERDVLADIIHAKMDYELEGDTIGITNVADEFLPIIDQDVKTLNWSYCY